MAANTNTMPGVEPPPGVRSNFVDPRTHNGLIITVAVLAVAFSTFFMCLRIYTRRFINHKLWWDDWTCILAWVGLIALAGLMFKALEYGGGVDLWNVPKASYGKFTKLFHKVEIVARVSMFFTKASIVLLYHRVFIPSQSRKGVIWWAIWFVFWWNLLYAVALILVVTTECIGKESRMAKGEECLDQSAIVIGATVINVVSDLMILAIPIVAIWGLQMAKKPKMRLLSVFAVGLMGVFASIARLGYLIPKASKPNQTVIIMVLLMFNIAEQTSGVVVSCMPVLPALLRHLSQHYSSHDSDTSNAKVFMNSFFANKRNAKTSGSRVGTDDPSAAFSEYAELTDIENQWVDGMPAKPAKSQPKIAKVGHGP